MPWIGGVLSPEAVGKMPTKLFGGRYSESTLAATSRCCGPALHLGCLPHVCASNVTQRGLGTQAGYENGQKGDTRGVLAHTNVTKTYCQVTL